jgi:hypothetical protein
MRHQIPPSPGQLRQSQFQAASTSRVGPSTACSARHAREVAQSPVSLPATAGHEPSGSCVCRRKCAPFVFLRLSGCSGLSPHVARTAQLVGSIALSWRSRNPQPPSGFCADVKSGRQTLSAKDAPVASAALIDSPFRESLFPMWLVWGSRVSICCFAKTKDPPTQGQCKQVATARLLDDPHDVIANVSRIRSLQDRLGWSESAERGALSGHQTQIGAPIPF